MSTYKLSPIVIALSAIFSSAIHANTLNNSTSNTNEETEVISITATPFETPVSSLAASVQIISASEIKNQANISQDISSMLASLVPGFGPDTEMMSTTYQGFRGRKSIIMIDGIVVSNSLRDTSRALSSIAIENIQRIEVIQGASAIYGNGESAGVINIITHTASDETVAFWSQVKIDGSVHDNDSLGYQASQRLSGTVDNFSYLGQMNWRTSGTIYDGDGEQVPSDPSGRGGLGELEDLDGLVKLAYHINNDSNISLNLHKRKLENELSFGRKTIFDNVVVVDKTKPFTGTTPYSDNEYAQFIWEHQNIAGHQVNIEMSLSNSENTQASGTNTQSKKQALRFAAQPLQLPRQGDVFTWGIDFQKDKTKQVSSKGICEICNVEQTNIAPFAEYQLNINNFMVQFGVRYENFTLDVPNYIATGRYGYTPFLGQEIQGGTLKYDKPVFNIGSVYKFQQSKVQSEIYAGFSQGYGLGDLRRLRSIDVANIESFDEKMKPSEANNVDFGYRMNMNDLHFDINFYYSRSKNAQSYVDTVDQIIYSSLAELDPRLTYDISTTFNPDAIDAVATRDEKVKGIELNTRYTLSDSILIGSTLSYSKGKYKHPTKGWIDMNYSRISPLKLTGYMNFDITENIGGYINIKYVDKQSGNGKVNLPLPQNGMWGSYEGYSYYNAPSSSYTTVDLSLFYQTKIGHFQLGVKNLFDKVYQPTYAQLGAASIYGEIDLPTDPTLDQLENSVRDFAYRDNYNAQGTTFSLSYQVEY